jgi:hypothetical protein
VGGIPVRCGVMKVTSLFKRIGALRVTGNDLNLGRLFGHHIDEVIQANHFVMLKRSTVTTCILSEVLKKVGFRVVTKNSAGIDFIVVLST